MPLASEYMNQLQPSLHMPSNNMYPHLVELICHDGVKTIGYRALYFCPSLKLVQIPGVMEIMAEAFAGCPLTHHVTFGDKLERIRKAAFRSCKSLKSITIPLKEDMLGIV
eukprot:scaffold26478_cov121-Skeletonema_marinoi.AAC.7